MNMMKKAKILDTDRLSIVELIEVVEAYDVNNFVVETFKAY